jgi:hypothetical protein
MSAPRKVLSNERVEQRAVTWLALAFENVIAKTCPG